MDGMCEGSPTVRERVKLQAFGAMPGALARSIALPCSCRPKVITIMLA
jgi:hypothetical protein